MKKTVAGVVPALLSIGCICASPLMAAEMLTAPPTALPALQFSDASGMPRSLADFRGHPVVLNLWATWCAPCLAEMPALDALAGSGVAVVAISEDISGPDLPARFLRQHHLDHLALYSDPSGGVGEALGVSALPLTLVINADGQEVGRALGAVDWQDPKLKATLEALRDR